MPLINIPGKLDHLFAENGAYVLFDGQYGSTGKGLAAAYLAEHTSDHLFGAVLTNAGPNSGHTFYVDPIDLLPEGDDAEFSPRKVVLKQLPTFSVYQRLRGRREPITVLTAGAVIDPVILKRECEEYGIGAHVHPNAALIDDHMRKQDGATVDTIASTGQGVGPAIQRKIGRRNWGCAVARGQLPNAREYTPNLRRIRALFEVSQGFSLGINQPFYPNCTSRECSAAQALSDGGVSPLYYRGGVMVVRTYPIRVGNAPNGASSGGHYADQMEINWTDIGQEPELTTVTKRQRRLFTFSWIQYREALAANTPTIVFANFLNYLPDEKHVNDFLIALWDEAYKVLGYPVGLIGGWGPRVTDCDFLGYR